MDRIKQKLGVQKSKENVNTDTLLKIDLEGKQRLLPFNNINEVVNVAELFNKERQATPFYRIIGTINPLVSNALFNLDDNYSRDNRFTWSIFNSFTFLDNSYPKDFDNKDEGDLIFPDAITKFLQENDGWFGYQIPEVVDLTSCTYYDMEPKRERFSFLPDMRPYKATTFPQPIKNWELTITYPNSIDSGHTLVRDGLLIIDATTITLSNRIMTAFSVPCKHNLNSGDSVRIIGTVGYNGTHTVNSIGLENGDDKDIYFVIDIPPTGTTNNQSRMVKMINGVPSQYYFRHFKKIKTRSTPVIETDDYETYQPGFALNAFTDMVVQFVFNEDIDVSDLKDNLGRPLSELYLTVIKTDSNGLFTPVSAGLEVPFIPRLKNSDSITYLKAVPAISRIHNGTGVGVPFVSHTPLDTFVNINDASFYGDLVEYNVTTLVETVLSVVNHRFNTLNRETPVSLKYLTNPASSDTESLTVSLGPRQEGYFYQAHYPIRIRHFSNYIEEGTLATEGLPTYAITLDGEKYIWKDLLDIGFNETDETPLDYPFLNGSHYMYQNLSFNLKRQDPFNLWGLYHGQFPPDPMGATITEKFITKTEDLTNDC